jgi:hypothetical protein
VEVARRQAGLTARQRRRDLPYHDLVREAAVERHRYCFTCGLCHGRRLIPSQEQSKRSGVGDGGRRRSGVGLSLSDQKRI